MESKTVEDLRNMLVQGMEDVRDGKSTPANLNALVNGAGKVFSSIKLEIEYAKATGKKPFIKMLRDSHDKPAIEDKTEAKKDAVPEEPKDKIKAIK